MATRITVGMVVQSRFFCFNAGFAQLAINTMYWKARSIVGGGADDVDFAAQLSASVAPLYKPLIATTAVYYGTQVRIIDPLPAALEQHSTVGNGVGTATGDPLPFQTCGLIQKRSNTGGKTGRGRLYIPFPAEGDNNNLGQPSPGYQANLNTLATFLIGSYTATTGGNSTILDPVLWNRTTRVAVFWTGYTIPAKWATQRRRGDFGRTNAVPF